MSTLQLLSPHPAASFSNNMDYSYFNSAPQPYQYFGMPHTPAQVQHMDMDNFNGQHQQQHSAAQFNSPFAAFQDSFQYDHPTFIHPAAAQSQLPSRAPSRPIANAPSISPGGIPPTFENVPMSTTEMVPPEDHFPHRSSSEEKDMLTPQQSKRKAQNRAAQRAFRERKEKHLKDLETKLNTLQQQSMALDTENERLRKEVARVATENEILRASSHGQPSLGDDEDTFGPLGYEPGEISSSKESTARRAQMLGQIHTIVIDDHSGELLLNSGKTWDYIQAHESFTNGLVDVGDVIDRLKKLARVAGQGPVFRESDIRKAISESAVAGGRDELLC